MQSTSIAAEGGLFEPFAGTEFGQPVDRSRLFWHKQKLPPLQPFFEVIDPEATILARYRDDKQGRGSVAMKRMVGWNSVFTGVHSLTPAMWRALAVDAGAHVYLDTLTADFDSPDVVEASSDFLMIQSGRDGPRTIRLPTRIAKIESFDSKRPETLAENTDTFTATFQKGLPRFFLLHP